MTAYGPNRAAAVGLRLAAALVGVGDSFDSASRSVGGFSKTYREFDSRLKKISVKNSARRRQRLARKITRRNRK